jgi:D-xylonolactonase
MISTLLEAHCELGENPLWEPESGMLYWTDIDAGKMHRLHLATRRHETIYHGPPVGGFTFQANGDLLLFRVEDLALLHPNGDLSLLRPFRDEGMARFNDVIADPEGRVYAGTIGRTEASGGLFRVDRGLTITLLFRGTGVSNGMGFSPDLSTFYWTCSTHRRISAFSYQRETGALEEARTFYQAKDDEGIPDGMTVDTAGHVWSARWDGHAIVEHRPNGTVVSRHRFPPAKVSSLCFGGEKLERILVTTAGGREGAGTPDGNLYEFPAPRAGRVEYRSRIGMG